MPLAVLKPAAFTSSSRYQEELAAIFERSWVHVADVSDVPTPGAYVPAHIGTTPLLVMRGDDGVVRTFLNACPHRGATLAEAPGTCDKTLRCPYHGWTFSASGEQRGVPHRDDFDCDVTGRNLLAVRSAELGPMIFACLDPAAPPFAAWAGDLGAAVAATGITRWQLAFEYDYRVKANWKTYVENGLDGYHVPFVHDFLRDALQLDTGENFYEPHASYTHVAPAPALMPPGSEAATIRFGHVFPNLIPVLSPLDLSYLRIDPLGPEEIRLRGRSFDSGEALPLPREVRSAAFDQTNQQDIAVVERVQRGLRARGLPAGVHTSLREGRITHFERMVTAALERGAA